MVDLVRGLSGTEAAATLKVARGMIQPALLTGRAALELVRQVSRNGIAGSCQQADWLDAWHGAHSTEPAVAGLLRHGEPLFALPLEVVRAKGMPVARYPGGRHANANFPVVARTAGTIPSLEFKAMLRMAGRQLGVHALLLERQLRELGGIANPLLSLPHGDSPNIALALSLEGGFEQVLSRHNGKRRKKKFRNQQRRLEPQGGYVTVRAETAADVDAMLGAFFAMKVDRFAQAGIEDVFAAQEVKLFFARLFVASLEAGDGRFELNAIRVGEVFAAVTGSSVLDERMTVEFGAIDSAFDFASPGDLLFYLSIEDACARGLRHFDFGVGDEIYKRNWCEIETAHFDNAIALSPLGSALAMAFHARARAVRFVKGNPRLWALVKAVRAGKATEKTTAAPSSDDAN